jgi:hypothetical protein
MADTQAAAGLAALPPQRPEYVRDVIAGRDIGVVQKPLTTWERLTNQNWVRKIFILVIIAAAWQAYAVYLNNSLLVPTSPRRSRRSIPAWSTARCRKRWRTRCCCC